MVVSSPAECRDKIPWHGTKFWDWLDSTTRNWVWIWVPPTPPASRQWAPARVGRAGSSIRAWWHCTFRATPTEEACPVPAFFSPHYLTHSSLQKQGTVNFIYSYTAVFPILVSSAYYVSKENKNKSISITKDSAMSWPTFVRCVLLFPQLLFRALLNQVKERLQLDDLCVEALQTYG